MGYGHMDIIGDRDEKCTIDPKTREITNNTLKNILLQYDHNCERISFSMPRQIEGHGMEHTDRVTVYYTNGISSGSYIVDDVEVSADGNTLSFSWLISRAATQHTGKLIFGINFRCFDKEGNVTYNWSTKPCSIFTVLEGVNETEGATYDEYNDLIGHFKIELTQILEELEYIKKVAGISAKNTYSFANIVLGKASACTIPSEETEA